MMEPKLWEELILHGFTKCSDYTSRDGVPRLPRGIAQVISRAPQQKVRNVELSIGQRASVSIMNTIWKHASNHVHSLSLAFTTTHPRYGGLDLRRHLPAFHQLAELKLRGKCVDYLLWDVDGAEAAPLTLPAQLKKLKLLDMESKIFQTEAWNIRGSIEGLECSGNRIWMVRSGDLFIVPPSTDLWLQTDLASFATTLQSLKVSNACLDYGHRYDSYRPVFLNMFVRLRVLSLTTVKSRVVGPLPVSFQTLLIKNCHVRYDFTAAQISFKQWMEVLGKNRCYGFPIDTKEERYVWDATNVLIRRATSEEEDENGSH